MHVVSRQAGNIGLHVGSMEHVVLNVSKIEVSHSSKVVMAVTSKSYRDTIEVAVVVRFINEEIIFSWGIDLEVEEIIILSVKVLRNDLLVVRVESERIVVDVIGSPTTVRSWVILTIGFADGLFVAVYGLAINFVLFVQVNV